MKTMFQRRWSDPAPLGATASLPSGPGIYIIGCAYDERLPIGASTDNEGKLGGFSPNFVPLYVGHSLSMRSGIRARISCHARRRGNRYVALALGRGVPLWFVFVSGRDMAEYETIYLDLPNGIYFPFNARSEVLRAMARMGRGLEEEGLIPLNPLVGEWTDRSQHL